MNRMYIGVWLSEPVDEATPVSEVHGMDHGESDGEVNLPVSAGNVTTG